MSASHVFRRAAALLGLLAGAAGMATAQPMPLRGLALTDHHQQPLRATALAQRPVLLSFVFAGCSTTCPLQVKELAALHDELPAAARAQVRFVSVTVDPLSDTPQALAAFAKRMGAERSGWAFATGKPDVVGTLLERMQTFPAGKAAPQPEDHRTSLYLFGVDGRLLQRFRGVPVDRPRLVAEITRLTAAPSP
jgi:protein SCO1